MNQILPAFLVVGAISLTPAHALRSAQQPPITAAAHSLDGSGTIQTALSRADLANAVAAFHEEACGSGHIDPSREPCLSHDQRRRITRQVQFGQARVAFMRFARSLLSGSMFRGPVQVGPQAPIEPTALVQFGWPIRAVGPAALDPGHHAISNFVDAVPGDGQRLDHNCGQRTYDGHRGTDIFTWPFRWMRMSTNEIEVIAAADGVIVLKSDGHQDQSCSWNGQPWNAVYVQHDDGSVAWYGHLKRGSLTNKPIGSSVAAGEFLGVMGSSGISTGPHLHFEVYDGAGHLVDPFAGPCQAFNARPNWVEQRPYYDSAVNRIQVGTAPAVFPSCPQIESPNSTLTLSRGTTGYFTAFYRDQLQVQVSRYTIRRPSGTVFSTWAHSSNAVHYSASWWWWSRLIPQTAPVGTWTFEVEFLGGTERTSFTVI